MTQNTVTILFNPYLRGTWKQLEELSRSWCKAGIVDQSGRRFGYTGGGGGGAKSALKILPVTTLCQRVLRGPLHELHLHLQQSQNCVFWLKTNFQRHKGDKPNRAFHNRLIKCLSLAETQRGIHKCHFLWSRRVTFIFININPENPTDDTGTAVWGRLPSWALQALFHWPVKATAWGRCPLPDSCSSFYARKAFHESSEGLNSYVFYLSWVEKWSTAANHQTQSEHVYFSLILVQQCWLKMHSSQSGEVCEQHWAACLLRLLMTILQSLDRSTPIWQEKGFNSLLV